MKFINVCLITYCSEGVAAHSPRPTSLTVGFTQPLWHIARANSSPMLPTIILFPKSAWYGRAGIRTHDPVVRYLVWLLAEILAALVPTAPGGPDRPTCSKK